MVLLSLEQLRALQILQREGKVSKVAELTGRTQPAITQQLKKLEATTGKRLFDRHGNRLSLTEAGDLLLGYAEQILQLNQEALKALGSEMVSGQIRLGIPSEFAVTLLPRIIGDFAKSYPDVTLDVSCDLSRNLVAQLDQQFDLVLALQDKVDARLAGFIKKDPLVWVGSKTAVVDFHKEITLVAAPEGCIYRQRALSRLSAAGLPHRLVYSIADLQGISAALNQGLGVTVLAESTVPDNLKILSSKPLPLLGNMGISVQVAQSPSSPAVKLLVDYLKQGLI